MAEVKVPGAAAQFDGAAPGVELEVAAAVGAVQFEGDGAGAAEGGGEAVVIPAELEGGAAVDVVAAVLRVGGAEGAAGEVEAALEAVAEGEAVVAAFAGADGEGGAVSGAQLAEVGAAAEGSGEAEGAFVEAEGLAEDVLADGEFTGSFFAEGGAAAEADVVGGEAGFLACFHGEGDLGVVKQGEGADDELSLQDGVALPGAEFDVGAVFKGGAAGGTAGAVGEVAAGAIAPDVVASADPVDAEVSGDGDLQAVVDDAAGADEVLPEDEVEVAEGAVIKAGDGGAFCPADEGVGVAFSGETLHVDVGQTSDAEARAAAEAQGVFSAQGEGAAFGEAQATLICHDEAAAGGEAEAAAVFNAEGFGVAVDGGVDGEGAAFFDGAATEVLDFGVFCGESAVDVEVGALGERRSFGVADNAGGAEAAAVVVHGVAAGVAAACGEGADDVSVVGAVVEVDGDVAGEAAMAVAGDAVVGAAVDVEGDVAFDAAQRPGDGGRAADDVAFKAGAVCAFFAEVEGDVAVDRGAFEAGGEGVRSAVAEAVGSGEDVGLDVAVDGDGFFIVGLPGEAEAAELAAFIAVDAHADVAVDGDVAGFLPGVAQEAEFLAEGADAGVSADVEVQIEGGVCRAEGAAYRAIAVAGEADVAVAAAGDGDGGGSSGELADFRSGGDVEARGANLSGGASLVAVLVAATLCGADGDAVTVGVEGVGGLVVIGVAVFSCGECAAAQRKGAEGGGGEGTEGREAEAEGGQKGAPQGEGKADFHDVRRGWGSGGMLRLSSRQHHDEQGNVWQRACQGKSPGPGVFSALSPVDSLTIILGRGLLRGRESDVGIVARRRNV